MQDWASILACTWKVCKCMVFGYTRKTLFVMLANDLHGEACCVQALTYLMLRAVFRLLALEGVERPLRTSGELAPPVTDGK